jgi:hypothetical protein
MQLQTYYNGVKSFTHKRTRCIGPWRWRTCETKYHNGQNSKWIFWRKWQDKHHGWKKGIEIFSPKLEVMVSYGFQASKMCSHYQVETIRVVMVWCIRCELKGSITSQTPLSWQGRHPTWLISGKCVSNIWWKF